MVESERAEKSAMQLSAVKKHFDVEIKKRLFPDLAEDDTAKKRKKRKKDQPSQKEGGDRDEMLRHLDNRKLKENELGLAGEDEVTGWQMGSIFGGMLTLATGLVLAYLAVDEFRAIFEEHQSTMARRINMYDEDKRPAELISFSNFDNSMNLIFGISNYDANWDVLNNPYVRYTGQILSNGMKLTNSLELHICPDEEKGRFVPEHNFGWYPQAICFKDREATIIHKNWFMDDYATPAVAISYCKNTTENNYWCKSKDEIDVFLRQYASYFVHMVTYVQEDIYPGHDALSGFPYNGNDTIYFPTVTEYASIKYGTIVIDPVDRDRTFLLDEIKVDYSTIRINDDPWEILPLRETSFLNMKWFRDLQDSIYGGYDFDDSNVQPEDYIRMYFLSMDNIGFAYERKILTVNEVVATLGGLAGSIIGAFAFIDAFFGTPFRELDRDVSFRHL